MTLSALRQYIKRGNGFTGHCKTCVAARMRERYMDRLKTNGSTGKHINCNGYVVLSPYVVPEADMPIFRAMYTKGCKRVFEHRYVMAKHLGRPLTRNECIDHMDGNKKNNKLSNLRLYRMHTNDAGNTPGHGTYYHEWQMALAEIERLKNH